MKKISFYIFLILSVSIIYPALYDIGESVSIEHQNLTYETCYSGNDYAIGDNLKLADWNGDLNGGNYNVIVVIMSASW